MTTADKLAYLNDTKAAIQAAIVEKGVEVPEGTTFREYAGKIGEIETKTQFKKVRLSVDGYTFAFGSGGSYYSYDGEVQFLQGGFQFEVDAGSVIYAIMSEAISLAPGNCSANGFLHYTYKVSGRDYYFCGVLDKNALSPSITFY